MSGSQDSLRAIEKQADFLIKSIGYTAHHKSDTEQPRRYQAEVLTTKRGYNFTSNIDAENEVKALETTLSAFEGLECTVCRVVIDQLISAGRRFHLAKGLRIP